MAYHILQSGVTCRLPKTPRTPKSILRHYFDVSLSPSSHVLEFSDHPLQESIDSRSEYADEVRSASAFSAVSNLDNWDKNTLGDLSPDAL